MACVLALALWPLAPRSAQAALPGTAFEVCTAAGVSVAVQAGDPAAPADSAHGGHCTLCTAGGVAGPTPAEAPPPLPVSTSAPVPCGLLAHAPMATPWPAAQPRAPPQIG